MANSPSMIDDEIAALNLQLEDIKVSSQTGKHPVGQPKDLDHAHASYRSEVEQRLTFLNDQKLVRSLTIAIQSDSPEIARLLLEDQQTCQDRNLALRMGGRPAEIENGDQDTTISQALGRLMIESGPSSIASAGPSTALVVQPARIQARAVQSLLRRECTACSDLFTYGQTLQLPCKHFYCVACSKKLFINATKDQEAYPPRCCRQNIPRTLIQTHLSATEQQAFNDAVVEWNTPNRVYCSNKRCGKFVAPSSYNEGGSRASCVRCRAHTCVHCKGEAHTGDCPEDPALKQTLALAKEQGWQQCTNCSSVVELTIGCYHMRCKCNHQFCYLCGVRWKKCRCVRFEEGRLLERAAEVVNRREIRGAQVHAAARAREVRQVAENLRANHECAHPGRLDRVTDASGPWDCELCTKRHGNYIFRCPTCHTQVCHACLLNRLR